MLIFPWFCHGFPIFSHILGMIHQRFPQRPFVQAQRLQGLLGALRGLDLLQGGRSATRCGWEARWLVVGGGDWNIFSWFNLWFIYGSSMVHNG